MEFVIITGRSGAGKSQAVAALEDIGYSGYITIEQERDPRNVEGSLRDVKASVEYLKGVGYQI